jgi:acyl-CoA thioester hydrolase
LHLSPEFVTDLVANESDMDALGHVSNLVYVRWIQDVAKAHSIAVGWDHEAYIRLGAVFVVRRHEVDYLLPAYGGDAIRLVTYVAGWSAATADRRTSIVRLSDGREIARARTTWALVTIGTGRPRRVPPEIMAAFERSVAHESVNAVPS